MEHLLNGYSTAIIAILMARVTSNEMYTQKCATWQKSHNDSLVDLLLLSPHLDLDEDVALLTNAKTNHYLLDNVERRE